MSDPIYLDYNATTPVAPEVLQAMLPWLREQFGNASSSHAFGKRAAAAVAHAREQVADMIGAHADEIVFTGCATESNNVAVLGVAAAQDHTASPAPVGARSAAKRHIVISAIEHPAVMAPAISLRERGWRVTIVPVDVTGRIQIERLEEALGSDTALVSVMHANNEVGTVQPITRIAQLARARGIVMHTDAAQSAGKLPLHVDDARRGPADPRRSQILRAERCRRFVCASRYAHPIHPASAPNQERGLPARHGKRRAHRRARCRRGAGRAVARTETWLRPRSVNAADRWPCAIGCTPD